MMSERAVLPDIGKLNQDPMSQVGYPTGVVGFHGLFGCKPLGITSTASGAQPLTKIIDATRSRPVFKLELRN